MAHPLPIVDGRAAIAAGGLFMKGVLLVSTGAGVQEVIQVP